MLLKFVLILIFFIVGIENIIWLILVFNFLNIGLFSLIIIFFIWILMMLLIDFFWLCILCKYVLSCDIFVRDFIWISLWLNLNGNICFVILFVIISGVVSFLEKCFLFW